MCIVSVEVLDCLNPDIASKVADASTHSLAERIWRLPQRKHSLYPDIRCAYPLSDKLPARTQSSRSAWRI
jgi:hypothetical protein